MPDASSVTVVPVLFVSEPIVLPTMVVAIELDDEASRSKFNGVPDPASE